MFDNPRKELERLEEELLKNSPEDEDFEGFYQDVFDEFGPTEETPAASQIKWLGRTYADIPRAVAPEQKQRVAGLVVLICLELVGIAGVAAWWLLRIL